MNTEQMQKEFLGRVKEQKLECNAAKEKWKLKLEKMEQKIKMLEKKLDGDKPPETHDVEPKSLTNERKIGIIKTWIHDNPRQGIWIYRAARWVV